MTALPWLLVAFIVGAFCGLALAAWVERMNQNEWDDPYDRHE